MEMTEALVLANIILTAVVGIVSSTRFKCRFGKGKSISIAPKDAPSSPDSVQPSSTPEARNAQRAKERDVEAELAQREKDMQLRQDKMVRDFVALAVPQMPSRNPTPRAPTPMPTGMQCPMTPEELV